MRAHDAASPTTVQGDSRITDAVKDPVTTSVGANRDPGPLARGQRSRVREHQGTYVPNSSWRSPLSGAAPLLQHPPWSEW